MENKPPLINLLKEKREKFLDKFITWMLTFGRLVVILTETIALLSFLYRFSLDRKLVDLHERIAQKEAIIRLQQANEEKYRDIQDRLTIVSEFAKYGPTTNKILTDVINLSPDDFTFNNLVLSNNNLQIDGRARSVATIKKLLNGLKSYPLTSSVSLNRIENKTASATILVSITATFLN